MTESRKPEVMDANAQTTLYVAVVDDRQYTLPNGSWRYPTLSSELWVHFAELPQVNSVEAFRHAEAFLSTLEGSWVIFLDLYFRRVEASGVLRATQEETERWVIESLEGSIPDGRPLGIHLLKVAAENHSWSGVLAVASTQLQFVGSGDRQDPDSAPNIFLQTFRPLFDETHRKLVLLPTIAAGGPAQTRCAVVEGLGEYFKSFVPELSLVSHVHFYLTAKDGTWFPWLSHDERSSSSLFLEQLSSVTARYPMLSEREAAAAAFYCGTSADQRKHSRVRKAVPAALFRAVIPATCVSEDLNQALVCLPCEPGMAFLLAASALWRHLMGDAEAESVDVKLRLVDGDAFREHRVAVSGCVADNQDRYLLLEFVHREKGVVNGELRRELAAPTGGNTRGLIHAALDCCVEGPGTGVPNERDMRFPLLRATLANPIRSVQGWTVVHPWINVDEGSIGLAWPSWDPTQFRQFYRTKEGAGSR